MLKVGDTLALLVNLFRDLISKTTQKLNSPKPACTLMLQLNANAVARKTVRFPHLSCIAQLLSLCRVAQFVPCCSVCAVLLICAMLLSLCNICAQETLSNAL